VPYEFIAGSNYLSLVEWENAEKELHCMRRVCCRGCFSEQHEGLLPVFEKANTSRNNFVRPDDYLLRYDSLPVCERGSGLCSILGAQSGFVDVYHWHCIACSGIAIILKIKTGLIAFLLGAMILAWFIVLHIPRSLFHPFHIEQRSHHAL